jgi:hypothetical protein
MITCRLKGGLGNMMFEISAIESMSRSTNGKIKSGYYNVDSQIKLINDDIKHNPNLKHAGDYLKMFKNFNWPRITPPRKKIDVSFEYTKINIVDDTIYDGFFQSEKYFPDRNFVLWLFEPSDLVNNQLKKYDELLNAKTCSIHIRRGDYLKFGMHVVRDISYYEQAMKEIGEVDRYIIFSDDIQWCKDNFKGSNFFFIENEKDYIEIFLQSKCSNNIISSSSFSWWGAYLNKNPNKIVIGPKSWFNSNKYNSKDIIPDTWQTI